MSPESELPLCHHTWDFLGSELSVMMLDNEVHGDK